MKEFGQNPEDFICRVEVVDEQKQLQVLYFPQPEIIKEFWDNYYVQELYKNGMWKIRRDYPEQKLGDFEDHS